MQNKWCISLCTMSFLAKWSILILSYRPPHEHMVGIMLGRGPLSCSFGSKNAAAVCFSLDDFHYATQITPSITYCKLNYSMFQVEWIERTRSRLVSLFWYLFISLCLSHCLSDTHTHTYAHIKWTASSRSLNILTEKLYLSLGLVVI